MVSARCRRGTIASNVHDDPGPPPGRVRSLPNIGTHIAITTTGVFSDAALIAAIQEVGVDNVMFSIDYPFESTEKAVQFIRTAPLAPADQARLAHVNAERILRLNQ